MLDKASDRSIYLQIADQIKNKIDTKTLSVGDSIDSENKLSEKYQVSRLTARRAVDHLVNLGYLYRIRGKGTFVLEREAVNFTPQKLHGFTEEILNLNMTPKNTIIEFKIMKAPKKISEKLDILTEDMVYYVRRVRCIEDEPLILEDSYLPVKILPELNISALSNSKYEYIEKFTNKKILESFQEFEACLAGNLESHYLNIKEGDPLLVITNQSFLEDGTIFEYSTAYYKKSKHKISQKAKRD